MPSSGAPAAGVTVSTGAGCGIRIPAIGASVPLSLADGATETAEIQAGGGYYSESSPAAVFGYPDGNPPRKLSIRWPNGTTSTQDLASPPASITVTQ